MRQHEGFSSKLSFQELTEELGTIQVGNSARLLLRLKGTLVPRSEAGEGGHLKTGGSEASPEDCVWRNLGWRPGQHGQWSGVHRQWSVTSCHPGADRRTGRAPSPHNSGVGRS